MNRFFLATVLVGLLWTSELPVNAAELKGEIKIDGSSTVYLITEAVADEFKKQYPEIRISVGISGTGGGFKKFAAGETDISDASRAIKAKERKACEDNNIDFVELQVAWDGLTVVVHPENTWAEKMTVAQLRKIWHPQTAVKKWRDVDPTWPNEEIKLYGPGSDSGTFDFFTKAINGEEKLSRADFQASEDDNTIVRGVAGDKYALGYFGFAYYEENSTKLKSVAIAPQKGEDYILPTRETVFTQTYKPLSRPLFIYVRTSSLGRPEIRKFVEFYLRRGDLVKRAKYIALGARERYTVQQKLKKAVK